MIELLQNRKPLGPDEVGLAWAASLFNGEGSTWVQKGNGGLNRYFCLSIGQKNREVLDIFQEIVQEGSINGPDKQGGHKWRASNERAVEVIWKISPWLSIEKREQAIRCSKEVQEFNEGRAPQRLRGEALKKRKLEEAAKVLGISVEQILKQFEGHKL